MLENHRCPHQSRSLVQHGILFEDFHRYSHCMVLQQILAIRSNRSLSLEDSLLSFPHCYQAQGSIRNTKVLIHS